MQNKEKTKDLGFENGWSVYPEIVKNCKHERQYISAGHALVKTVCTVCNYHFLTDSSD